MDIYEALKDSIINEKEPKRYEACRKALVFLIDEKLKNKLDIKALEVPHHFITNKEFVKRNHMTSSTVYDHLKRSNSSGDTSLQVVVLDRDNKRVQYIDEGRMLSHMATNGYTKRLRGTASRCLELRKQEREMALLKNNAK